jgi:hypothetical protein
MKKNTEWIMPVYFTQKRLPERAALTVEDKR